MAQQKIYVETTGELVIVDENGEDFAYPAFTELKRGRRSGGKIVIFPVGSVATVAHIEDATEWQNKAGVNYADSDALYLAIEPFFDDQV